jgi:cytoskeletal protein CcmA (bactofilin family)
MEQLITKSNLIINGVSHAGGGEYALVRIDGVGTIQGNVSADVINTNGMTKVLGNVFTEELDCDGMLKIEGHFSAGHSVIDGHMNVKGSLKGDQFTLRGILNIGGDCEIEQFDVEGAFDVQGLLNVGRMNVKLHGRGKAKEIGVEYIQVRQGAKSAWNKLWRWMLPRFTPELHVGVIEGDDIDLEYTEADVVRGNRITIGKGCTIGRVEYRSELKQHKGAKIGQEVKTGA